MISLYRKYIAVVKNWHLGGQDAWHGTPENVPRQASWNYTAKQEELPQLNLLFCVIYNFILTKVKEQQSKRCKNKVFTTTLRHSELWVCPLPQNQNYISVYTSPVLQKYDSDEIKTSLAVNCVSRMTLCYFKILLSEQLHVVTCVVYVKKTTHV